MTDLYELLEAALPPPPEWWAEVIRKRAGFSRLRAPFPWFGGKERAADLFWDRVGPVKNYVEPFYGSGAVLLGRPHAPVIETVNDIDGFVVNFWRAIGQYPQEVADASEWPVMEADLHARHAWLIEHRDELTERLMTDPFYCDPVVAGWWVWGLCAWIGGGWCASSTSRKMPRPIGGGAEGDPRPQHKKGIHARGMRLPMLGAGVGGEDRHACAHHGRGVHGATLRAPSRQLPDLAGPGGERGEFPAFGRGINTRENRTRLDDLFEALSVRLRCVRFVCGDFMRVLSKGVTWAHGDTAILLDPPYADDCTTGLYSHGDELRTFHRAARWAIANGDDLRLKIAFCFYEGARVGLVHDEDLAEAFRSRGWSIERWKAKGGMSNQDGENENASRERIAFSPACKPRQARLFEV